MRSKHSTLSGLISTQTVAQFSQQNESLSEIIAFNTTNYSSRQTSVRNSWDGATVPRIHSRSYDSNQFAGDGRPGDTRSSFGKSQGNKATNSRGYTATLNEANNTYGTTSSAAGYGTTVSFGLSYSVTEDLESTHDSQGTMSIFTAETTRHGTTANRGRDGTNGGFNGNYTRDYGASQTISFTANRTGITQETINSFESINDGGQTATFVVTTVDGEGETVTEYSTNSSPFTQTFGGANTTTTSFSRAMNSTSTILTRSGRTYEKVTYSRTTRFIDTITSSQIIFANSDTTITAKKTTRSTGVFTFYDGDTTATYTAVSHDIKDVTRDTLQSSSIEIDRTETAYPDGTIPINIASTFTVYGNAGFVTASKTGTFDLKMTAMPQRVTSPGVLKPSNEDFVASLSTRSEEPIYTYSSIRTSRDASITNKTTLKTFESREAEYSRQSNESYIAPDGNVSYSSILINTTTESFFQTTTVSERTNGTKFYTQSFSGTGSAKQVKSIVQSTAEKVTPVVFFDGSNFNTTENKTTVYITTTGDTHKTFRVGVPFDFFAGSLFQTRGLSFNAPRNTEARPLVTDNDIRIHTARESVFAGERAFVQETTNSSDRLFAKQFPPILDFVSTLTTGDSSAPTTTTTSSTYITGLGSIRPYISLMLSDTSFTISDFQQDESTGVANGRSFTIQEVGNDTDINYEEDEKVIFGTTPTFVGGINNVTSNGFITVSNLASFGIGNQTFSVSSNETFMTEVDFSTMQKIQQSSIPFASHAKNRIDNRFGNRILISHLNEEFRNQLF